MLRKTTAMLLSAMVASATGRNTSAGIINQMNRGFGSHLPYSNIPNGLDSTEDALSFSHSAINEAVNTMLRYGTEPIRGLVSLEDKLSSEFEIINKEYNLSITEQENFAREVSFILRLSSHSSWKIQQRDIRLICENPRLVMYITNGLGWLYANNLANDANFQKLVNFDGNYEDLLLLSTVRFGNAEQKQNLFDEIVSPTTPEIEIKVDSELSPTAQPVSEKKYRIALQDLQHITDMFSTIEDYDKRDEERCEQKTNELLPALSALSQDLSRSTKEVDAENLFSSKGIDFSTQIIDAEQLYVITRMLCRLMTPYQDGEVSSSWTGPYTNAAHDHSIFFQWVSPRLPRPGFERTPKNTAQGHSVFFPWTSRTPKLESKERESVRRTLATNLSIAMFGAERTEALLTLWLGPFTFDFNLIKQLFSLPASSSQAFCAGLANLQVYQFRLKYENPSAEEIDYITRYIHLHKEPSTTSTFSPSPWRRPLSEELYFNIARKSKHSVVNLAQALYWLKENDLSTPDNKQKVFDLAEHLTILGPEGLGFDWKPEKPEDVAPTAFKQRIFNLVISDTTRRLEHTAALDANDTGMRRRSRL